MGTTLRIYEQNVTFFGENARMRKQLDEVACIWSSELIEKIQEKGEKNWHISSECGAEFELLGDEVLEFAEEIKKYDKDFNDKTIDIDEWYRCEVCY